MKRIGLAIILVLLMAIPAMAVGSNGFVVGINKDGRDIKEISGEVAMPFYSEYKVKLKNSNDRRCVAKVFIDGKEVSNLGDIIVNANSDIELERFLDRSLNEGKKFKFVPVNHPEVDDPASPQNGVIRVEFRPEKKYVESDIQIWLNEHSTRTWMPTITDTSIISTGTVSTLTNISTSTFLSNAYSSTIVNCSNSTAGATIGGNESYQKFSRTYFDVEDSPIVLQLKLVGIN